MVLAILIMLIINLNFIIIENVQAQNYEKVKNKSEVINTNEEPKILEINENIIWSIEIPAINLTAEIGEGTTDETMNKYVGHFTNTEFWQGNVGLAAHNRRISCKLFWKT